MGLSVSFNFTIATYAIPENEADKTPNPSQKGSNTKVELDSNQLLKPIRNTPEKASKTNNH